MISAPPCQCRRRLRRDRRRPLPRRRRVLRARAGQAPGEHEQLGGRAQGAGGDPQGAPGRQQRRVRGGAAGPRAAQGPGAADGRLQGRLQPPGLGLLRVGAHVRALPRGAARVLDRAPVRRRGGETQASAAAGSIGLREVSSQGF